MVVKVSISDAQPDDRHTKSSGAKDVRLFRNGSLVHLWHGDAFDKGGNWTFNINPTSLAMYTNSGYGTNALYRSINGGVDWTDVTPKGSGAPGFAGSLRMDWDDPKHLMLTWHTACGGANNEFKYEDQVGCFAESKDGGDTSGQDGGIERFALALDGEALIELGDDGRVGEVGTAEGGGHGCLGGSGFVSHSRHATQRGLV